MMKFNSIEVVAAAICKDGKVLAAKRGYGEFKGRWEFPGGKVKAGEALQEALIREIHEEMEVTIEVGEKVGTVEYDYPNFHLTLHCFFATVKEGNLSLLEHEDAMWLGKDNLHTVDWLPADIKLVECIVNSLKWRR